MQAGEYVSLGKVEAELKTCSVVENICVYGDPSKQFTVALVVPNQKHLEDIAMRQGLTGIDFEDLCASPVVEKAVIRELAEHAKKCKTVLHLFLFSFFFQFFSFAGKLQRYEVPVAVTLCKEVWSPDMGLVTAAFKLKRKDIQDRYQHDINRMYAS